MLASTVLCALYRHYCCASAGICCACAHSKRGSRRERVPAAVLSEGQRRTTGILLYAESTLVMVVREGVPRTAGGFAGEATRSFAVIYGELCFWHTARPTSCAAKGMMAGYGGTCQRRLCMYWQSAALLRRHGVQAKRRAACCGQRYAVQRSGIAGAAMGSVLFCVAKLEALTTAATLAWRLPQCALLQLFTYI
ncbi:hypothetical protein NPIL_508791 [Nephila pilipes]|uniref:Uncharacterized protein n=1 Tax=Nephila pilipes TaxID=299642 RepID=A0A8X6TY85_NEPPI|nr:hypothetical protein NPIL_508791 [Nephila pilipes]